MRSFLFLSSLSLCTCLKLYSCGNCVEAEINGPECIQLPDCIPGWKSTNTGDMITSSTTWPQVVPCYRESFDGGGSAGLLWSHSSDYRESMAKDLVLIPGLEYYLVFEVLNCFGPSEVTFAVGNTEVMFFPTDNWETVSICFTASGNDAIEITNSTSGNQNSYFFVDYFSCPDVDPDDVDCSESYALEVYDSGHTCPGSEYYLISTIGGVEIDASVPITWSCDPPSGLNYLDDISDPSPTFILPQNSGEPATEFIFTLTVDINSCILEADVTIEIDDEFIPQFDLVPCDDQTLEDLPTASLDGYTGQWQGPTDFSGCGGQNKLLTFLIDPDQNNCLTEYEYEFFIAPSIRPNFSNLNFCSDLTIFDLPTISDDGYVGSWEGPTDFNGCDGEFKEFIFTIEENQGICSQELVYEIYIIPLIEPSFSNLEICALESLVDLPSVTDNGYTGTWQGPDDFDACAGESKQFIFTLDPGQDNCFYFKIFELYITPAVIPDFDDLRICVNQEIADLPTFSYEGYSGYWEGIDDFISYENELINLTFFIDPDQDNCLLSHTYTLLVESKITPEFDFPLEYCISDSSKITLPETASNSIEGFWDVEDFRPYELGIGTHQNTFFADTEIYPCAEDISIDIVITDALNLEFSIPELFCIGESFVFPDISINGQNGSWSIAQVDNLSGGFYQNTFTPNDLGCINNFIFNFQIIDINLDFSINHPSECDSDDGVINLISSDSLEYSIDGGNTWQSELSIDGLSFGDYTLDYRFDQGDLCPDSFEFTINGSPKPEIESLDISDSQSCSFSDGSLFVNIDILGDYEYSIDNGLTWQNDPQFSNLDAGSYEISVRVSGDNNCLITQAFDIQGAAYPILDDLTTTNITNCNAGDGSISALASGNNLSFSIDNGITWQANPTFENLNAGDYNILIRSDENDDCTIDISTTLTEPILPDISSQIINPTSCQSQDGQIIISSPFPNIDLEFSLDNISWSSNSTFDNLQPGLYIIQYRLAVSPNCSDALEISLVSPEMPVIENLISTNDSSCLEDNGFIEIIVDQSNIEFSIDGGINWQNSGLFDQLSAGDYFISVRSLANPDCQLDDFVTIETAIEPNIIDVINQPTSDCDTDDGIIEVIADGLDLEYSIDGGINWQSQNIFENLKADSYNILVREINAPDCLSQSNTLIGTPLVPKH